MNDLQRWLVNHPELARNPEALEDFVELVEVYDDDLPGLSTVDKLETVYRLEQADSLLASDRTAEAFHLVSTLPEQAQRLFVDSNGLEGEEARAIVGMQMHRELQARLDEERQAEEQALQAEVARAQDVLERGLAAAARADEKAEALEDFDREFSLAAGMGVPSEDGGLEDKFGRPVYQPEVLPEYDEALDILEGTEPEPVTDAWRREAFLAAFDEATGQATSIADDEVPLSEVARAHSAALKAQAEQELSDKLAGRT